MLQVLHRAYTFLTKDHQELVLDKANEHCHITLPRQALLLNFFEFSRKLKPGEDKEVLSDRTKHSKYRNSLREAVCTCAHKYNILYDVGVQE